MKEGCYSFIKQPSCDYGVKEGTSLNFSMHTGDRLGSIPSGHTP